MYGFFRASKQTRFRGASARNLQEEFEVWTEQTNVCNYKYHKTTSCGIFTNCNFVPYLTKPDALSLAFFMLVHCICTFVCVMTSQIFIHLECFVVVLQSFCCLEIKSNCVVGRICGNRI